MKPEQSKMAVSASALPGYDTVADLIPNGNFLRFTEVWSLRLEHFATDDFTVERRFVLEMAESLDLDERPLIRITMLRPQQCCIPDTRQIIGLAFEDIRSSGWETLFYRVYDYEMTDFDVTCHTIQLSRVPKAAG